MAKNTSYFQQRRFDKWDFMIYSFILITSLACLFPFMHVVAKSLSDNAYVLANKVFLWPKGWNFEAYAKVLADKSIVRSLYVTILITVLTTIIGMIVTICAAYPLSKRGLAGSSIVTFLFMFTMFFSGGLIPAYLLISELGMLDTIWSLVLPGAFSAFNLLILRSSIRGTIPESLEESARIDGASHIRILVSIVLPLSKPIMATLSLFYAVGRWNGYMDALFYIKQNIDLRPLQLKLYYLVVQASETVQIEMVVTDLTNPEVLKAACVVFATVPILLVYPFLQKYFVQGVMLGSVKG